MRTLLPIAAACALAGMLAAAETPTLALIVGNKEENSLAIVDPVSGKVVARPACAMGHRAACNARAPDARALPTAT